MDKPQNGQAAKWTSHKMDKLHNGQATGWISHKMDKLQCVQNRYKREIRQIIKNI